MSGLDQARGTARYVAAHPVPGVFTSGAGSIEVLLRDVSVLGAQIEHTQTLRPAMRGRLVIETLDAPAVVVWTRMIVPGTYRSGLRLEEKLEVVAAAIRDLLVRGSIRKEGDTQRQRERARMERTISKAEQRAANPMQRDLAAEAIGAIHSARKWLTEHPEDAVKWHQRARMTATDAQIKIAESGRLNREDVLAVWEYLGRRFGLPDIVRALDRPQRR